jgi:hypothetical protein
MGRYYYGDIQGKFWFGVQNSDDASYFGVEPEYLYEFLDCGCHIEIYKEKHDDLTNDLYCTECFASLEEHREAVEEEKTWFLRELSFSFSKFDLPIIERNVSLLSTQVGSFLRTYEINDGDEMSYEYTMEEGEISKISDKQMEELARLCLGKLILHCVETKDECNFFAEI